MKLRSAIPLGLGLGLCGGPVLDGSLLAQAAWELRSSGTSQPLNDVAFGHGRYVAVGDRGTVLASVDGFNWRPEDAGSDWWLGEILKGTLVGQFKVGIRFFNRQRNLRWVLGEAE